jgi:hypothetical protein
VGLAACESWAFRIRWAKLSVINSIFMVWMGYFQTVVHAFASRKSALYAVTPPKPTTSKLFLRLHHNYISFQKARFKQDLTTSDFHSKFLKTEI